MIEQTGRGERAFDIYSRLLKERIVFLTGQVNDEVAVWFVLNFCFWKRKIPKKKFQFYINSPGGVVTSGLSILDTMNYIQCPVFHCCDGTSGQHGLVIVDMRSKRAPFCITQCTGWWFTNPPGGFQGQATDIEIHAREILAIKARLNQIYVEQTGQPLDVIEKAMERDNFMTAQEAKDFGLIDAVITKKPE